MAETRFYKQGDWDAICDECGGKFKASQLRLRWDNCWVCEQDWEIRQPQDFAAAEADPLPVPFQRPGNPGYSDATEVCLIGDIVAIPGYALPGCAIPGFDPSFL
jgi:hypothetical protein